MIWAVLFELIYSSLISLECELGLYYTTVYEVYRVILSKTEAANDCLTVLSTRILMRGFLSYGCNMIWAATSGILVAVCSDFLRPAAAGIG